MGDESHAQIVTGGLQLGAGGHSAYNRPGHAAGRFAAGTRPNLMTYDSDTLPDSGNTVRRPAASRNLFVTAAVVTLLLDQLSKWAVLRYLPLDTSFPGPESMIARVFTFSHVRNTGVALGLFQGKNSFFLALAAVVIVGLVLYELRTDAHDRMLHAALGMQVGGALGNVIDRVRLGHVVDFLSFKIFWPVFNVADSAIVLGVAMLSWHFWREERRREQAAQAATALVPESAAD